MTGVAISTQHHYGGSVIEPHTPSSATLLHELRQCVIDSMSHCKDSTQLEFIGFSWSTGGRHQSHLDGEGNPYVFLTKVIREPATESEDEDDTGDADKQQDGTEGEEAKARKRDVPVAFSAVNDLNAGWIQGVKMWEKEVWSGRL